MMLALDRAQATEVMARQPDGLDTLVGERGRTLSGGERQRLSIARALLKTADPDPRRGDLRLDANDRGQAAEGAGRR